MADDSHKNIYYFRHITETWPAQQALDYLYQFVRTSESAEEKYWAYTCIVALLVKQPQRNETAVVQALRSGWELKPDGHLINLMAANIAIERKQWVTALGHLIFCDPINPEVWFEFGCALEGLNLLHLARQAFAHGVTLAPNEERFQRRVRRLEENITE